MSYFRTTTFLALGLLILLTGCNDPKWSNWFQRNKETGPPPNTPQSVEATPVTPAPATEQGEQPTDPNQGATVDEVLAFVNRLNQTPAQTEQPAKAKRPAAQAATPPPVAARQPEPTPTAPNRPVDVQANQPTAVAAATPAAPVVESMYIPTANPGSTAQATAKKTHTTNAPLSATKGPAGQDGIQALIGALKKRVARQPEDVDAQWQLRLLQLATGDLDAARVRPKEVPEQQATLLGNLVETIVAVRDAMENPVTASSKALEHIDSLRSNLQDRTDLEIPKVALCTRVQTFGVYDEMPPGALLAHRPNRAIVYMEIANFNSEATKDNQFRTVLSDELVVMTPDGRSLWQHREPNIVDVSRQRRSDFFLAQIVELPPNLAPGEYVLKVSVVDEVSGKSNQAIHRFSVSQGSVASARP